MKTAYKKAKDELWKLVSKYVRLSHADLDGNVECITCHVKLPWQRIQCGHYISRVHLGTFFDLRNLGPQCPGCNCKMYGNGRPDEFALYLINHYGQGILEELNKVKHEGKKYKTYELQELIEEYKDKLVGLDIKRGYL